MTIAHPHPEDPSRSVQHLRKLAHDVRTPLSVICTGMEALRAVRDDADRFAEVYKTIQEQGVGPLQESVSKLVEAACEHESTPNGEQ